MRVTGGTAKGQQLKLPVHTRIRPTTDRTREAVFSLLASCDCGWDRVLDLYAGTGALGIESLSRDVGWADFVDREPRCCAIIKQNLEKVGFLQSAHVYCSSVSKALTFLDNMYDVVFMDPPYSDTALGSVIEQLNNTHCIGDSTLLVVSHASKVPLSESYGSLHMVKERRYGDTSISIFHREADK